MFCSLALQATNVDSLRTIIATEKTDSTNFKARIKLGYYLLGKNRDGAIAFADSMITDAKSKSYAYGEMYGWVIKANAFRAMGNKDSALVYFKNAVRAGKQDSLYEFIDRIQMFVGSSYSHLAKYDEAITATMLALEWAENGKDTATVASCYQNMGHYYFTMGDYNNALKSYIEAIRIQESRKNTDGIAFCQSNLGVVYREKKDYPKSIDYFKKSIANYRKLNQPKWESSCQAKLGHVYILNKEIDKAEGVLLKALNTQINNGFESNLASTYNSLGFLYKETELKEAVKYYKKAAEYAKKFNYEMFLGGVLINLGSVTYESNQPSRAIPLLLDGVKIADDYGKIEYISIGYNFLSLAYEKMGSYKNALKYRNLHLALKDSLLNIENLKQMNELEAEYESEKKEREIVLLNQQAKVDALKLQDEKQKSIIANEQKKSQQLLFGLGIGLLLLVTVFIYLGYRNKKKSNTLLTQQKNKIEQANETISLQRDIVNQKNKEITDSIQYAKRIQSAILPPDKLVKSYLENSFIYYKPKDIVAGDFYWLETVGTKVMFAAADCTGHGVPGAMVSVVCNNGLNRSLREFKLTSPGKILDKTLEIVSQEFDKSEEDVKDGMDIALCALQGRTLEYAGALNPLWIIRKGSNEIEEIKADKQPIGKMEVSQPYTTHKIELEEGDTIYIFSDGYADQFGGEKGKKMKTVNFKKLLLSINKESMERQKVLLDDAFKDWRGELDQLDDICVIGVRV